MDNAHFWFQDTSGGGGGGDAGDPIGESLRFRGAQALYTTSKAASGGDWTISFWFKQECVFSRASGGDNFFFMFGAYTNPLNLYINNNSSSAASHGVLQNSSSNFRFTGLVRDPSAWYHCVLQKSGSTTRGWLNGVDGGFSYATDLPIANAVPMAIGAHTPGTSPAINSFKGYFAEWHFVDGQALPPEAFGRSNSNGVWVPVDPKQD